MKFLIKLTSRSRVEKMFSCLDNIIENASGEDYKVLLTMDVDDPACANRSVADRLKTYKNVIPYWGFSDSKVSAINRDMEFAPKWDVLVNTSDDFIFTKKYFLSELHQLIRTNFTNLDFFLHLPDGQVNERLCTMSIMGKPYYDRTGYIYHPDYISLFCDQEAQEVAKRLGCYKYVDKHLFKHMHPAFGNAPTDAQYQHTESFYEIDGETFNRRQAKNFDL